MIINLFLNLIVLIIGVILSWLPTVTTLPLINGYDIDTAFVTGMSQLNSLFTTFWALSIMFQGFLFIMAYYILKLTLKFFLGHRSPIN